MFRLIFHPEVVGELSDAFLWYETQKNGLGEKFVMTVETMLAKIKNDPRLFSYSRKPFREAAIPFFLLSLFIKLFQKIKWVLYRLFFIQDEILFKSTVRFNE